MKLCTVPDCNAPSSARSWCHKHYLRWLAHKSTAGGYGEIRVDGRKARASHVAWFLTHGEWPGDLFVCHKCDNPACVNPAHLFLATPADNSRDMLRKGRHRISPRQGETHGRAKLTTRDVRRMRALAEDGMTLADIARKYEMNDTHVGRIVRRERWSHV